MGQYYKAILSRRPLNPVSFMVDNLPLTVFEPHSSNQGAKLMEHSWLKNPFVHLVERKLVEPHHIMWAGDYADPEEEFETYEINGEVYRKNWYSQTKNIITESHKTFKHIENFQGRYLYILNHTKKLYTTRNLPNIDGWIVHVLPLVTAEGNGRGGGDYRNSIDLELVGCWARDLLQISDEIPNDYNLVTFQFQEKC